jgi:hypothetical protein
MAAEPQPELQKLTERQSVSLSARDREEADADFRPGEQVIAGGWGGRAFGPEGGQRERRMGQQAFGLSS